MFSKIATAALFTTGALAAPTATTPDKVSRTTSLTGVTHSVIAGFNGLNFEPNNVVAEVGDIIQWEFLPANHTVVQSNFADPCQPLADGSGFFPGFQFPVAEGESELVYQIVVESDETIWYYCPQVMGNHCQEGMVGVINQNFDNPDVSLAKHKELAAKTGTSVVPPEIQGGKVLVNPNP